MGSFPSTLSQNQRKRSSETLLQIPSDRKENDTLDKLFRKEWERQFSVPKGELECMLSGYLSYAEFMIICDNLKRVCEIVPSTGKKQQNDLKPQTDLISTPNSIKKFIQSLFDIIVKYVPFPVSMLKSAPFLAVVEIIVLSVAKETDDVSNGNTAFQGVEKMLSELDLGFQNILKEIMPKMHSCMKAFSPENMSLKNNYFSSTEPIIASYISCSIKGGGKGGGGGGGKGGGGRDGCGNEFFVSLESRSEVLRSEKTINTTGGFFETMTTISGLISELLFVFVLRTLLHVARFIDAERKQKEWELQNNKLSTVDEKIRKEEKIKKFEKYILKFCADYELLAKEEFVKCRRYYPHVFALCDLLILWKDNEERPQVTSVIANMLLKLMYLFAGGLKSIAADDMRHEREENFKLPPKEGNCVDNLNKSINLPKEHQLTDDIALASCLSVAVCEWVTVVIVKLFGLYAENSDSTTVALCTTVLRVMYQHMGLLPFGAFCPTGILQWMDVFPLYTLNDNAKQCILRVYSFAAEQETRIMRPIDVNDFFRSFTKIMKTVESSITTHPKSKIATEVIVPTFFHENFEMSSFNDKSKKARCELLYDLFAESCTSVTQPTIDITKTVKIDLRNNILTSFSPSLIQELSNELTSSRIAAYYERTGAVLQWLSLNDVKEINRGDILRVECKVLSKNPIEINMDQTTSLNNSRGSVFQAQLSCSAIMNRSSTRTQSFCERKYFELDKKDGYCIMEFNFVIIWIYEICPGKQIVVFDRSLEVPKEFEVLSVKLVVYHISPFVTNCSGNIWTNCNFPYDPKNSRWAYFPFAFGWLLGHSLGNGVLLRLPIAPLMFRFLRYVVKYGVDLQACHMCPSILTLVDNKLWKQVEELDNNKLKVLFENAFENDKESSVAKVYALAACRTTQALIMNIENNVEKSLKFWSEVVEGFRTTPLGQSSLLTNCCARTVRNVLCGVISLKDMEEGRFCWEEHFVFLSAPKLDKLPYGPSLLKSLVQCLNLYFVGAKARNMLSFFTGSPLLPSAPLSECIFLTVSSDFEGSCSNFGVFDGELSLKMLPSQWPGHYVLEISGPVERFLFAQRDCSGAPSDLLDWKQLRLSGRTRALAAFQEAMRSLLEKATTTAKVTTTTTTTTTPPTMATPTKTANGVGELHIFCEPQRDVEIFLESDFSDLSPRVDGCGVNDVPLFTTHI